MGIGSETYGWSVTGADGCSWQMTVNLWLVCDCMVLTVAAGRRQLIYGWSVTGADVAAGRQQLIYGWSVTAWC